MDAEVKDGDKIGLSDPKSKLGKEHLAVVRMNTIHTWTQCGASATNLTTRKPWDQTDPAKRCQKCEKRW